MPRPTLRLNDGFNHTSPDLRDEVKQLQEELKNMGFKLKADGLFGKETEEAIKRIQRDNNQDDDGIVGPITWSVILKEEQPDISKVFQTTYAREHKTLKPQVVEIEKYKDYILENAASFNLQPCVIAGIGSRESSWGLMLKPPGCEGTGDTIKRKYPTQFRTGPLPADGGYGRGLMQIDFDAHEFARTGNWKNAAENIKYGCKVLFDSYNFMKRKTELTGQELLRAAIAGYNCGPGNVLRAYRDKLDIDYFTHGRDYSKDALNRAGWFQLHGWK